MAAAIVRSAASSALTQQSAARPRTSAQPLLLSPVRRVQQLSVYDASKGRTGARIALGMRGRRSHVARSTDERSLMETAALDELIDKLLVASNEQEVRAEA
jgi:hypothetical protein